MNKQLHNVLLFTTTVLTVNTIAQTTSNFEGLTLDSNSYWNGSSAPLGTTFNDGNAIFPNYYDTAWGGFWSSGWVYSNIEDSTTAGFTNLYGAATASGYNGSPNYAMGTQGSIIHLNSMAMGKVVDGFYVTNSTYGAISMRDGDSFAKKFGGASGDDPDWFKLTVRKWLGGVMTGDSVEFYLADYRFSNNAQDYIVKTWQWVDLTSLENVDSLQFNLSSSDIGSSGMNTPAYFCIDNFITKDSPSGIHEVANESILHIYPNPSTDFINVSLNKTQTSIVNIMDGTGKMILTETMGSNTLQIPVHQLPNGMYTILIMGERSSDSRKFIKQ